MDPNNDHYVKESPKEVELKEFKLDVDGIISGYLNYSNLEELQATTAYLAALEYKIDFLLDMAATNTKVQKVAEYVNIDLDQSRGDRTKDQYNILAKIHQVIQVLEAVSRIFDHDKKMMARLASIDPAVYAQMHAYRRHTTVDELHSTKYAENILAKVIDERKGFNYEHTQWNNQINRLLPHSNNHQKVGLSFDDFIEKNSTLKNGDHLI